MRLSADTSSFMLQMVIYKSLFIVHCSFESYPQQNFSEFLNMLGAIRKTIEHSEKIPLRTYFYNEGSAFYCMKNPFSIKKNMTYFLSNSVGILVQNNPGSHDCPP